MAFVEVNALKPDRDNVYTRDWFLKPDAQLRVEDPAVAFLRAEVDRLRADLAAALASERRLWAAYSHVRGAATRAAGAGRQVAAALKEGYDVDGEQFYATLNGVNQDIDAAEKLAGVAGEG